VDLGVGVISAITMLGLALWGLDRGSMYSGEAATYYAAHLSVPDLFRLLRHVDVVHGLYYMIMHGVLSLGGGEVVMRLPSVLAMAAAVGLTAFLGTRLSGSAVAGLLAGLVLAINPLVNEYASAGRSYALVYLGVVASCAVLVHILRIRAHAAAEQWRGWLVYAVLLTVTGYLNEMAIAVVAAHGVTLLWIRAGRRVLVPWLVSVVASLVVMVPLILLSRAQSSQVNWIKRPPLRSLIALVKHLVGTNDIVVLVLLAIAVVGALPAAVTRSQAADPAAPPVLTLPALAVPLFLASPLLVWVESQVRRPLFVERYFLWCSAGAALLVGAGLVRLAGWLRLDERAALIAGVAVLALAMALQLGVQQHIRTPQGRPEDYAAAAKYVNAHARAGDGVVFLPDNFRNMKLGYPNQFRALSDFALVRTPQQSGNLRGVTLPPAAATAALRSHSRIWQVGSTWRQANFGSAAVRAMAHALLTDYRVAKVRRFHGVTVRLFQRKPAIGSM
jgi:mannosyltransferase